MQELCHDLPKLRQSLQCYVHTLPLPPIPITVVHSKDMDTVQLCSRMHIDHNSASHEFEILACIQSKYNCSCIVASVDKYVKVSG